MEFFLINCQAFYPIKWLKSLALELNRLIPRICLFVCLDTYQPLMTKSKYFVCSFILRGDNNGLHSFFIKPLNSLGEHRTATTPLEWMRFRAILFSSTHVVPAAFPGDIHQHASYAPLWRILPRPCRCLKISLRFMYQPSF